MSAPLRTIPDKQPDNADSPASLSHLIKEELRAYFRAHGEALPAAGLHALIMPHMERPLLELTLEHTQGNQLRAAKILGINRNTLRKKIQTLGIDSRKLTEKSPRVSHTT